MLFGLGFDTASEIAVLGLSAVASRDTHISLWVVMAFPLLFAAGMTLVDSIDAVMLLRAYEWSRHCNGYRKLFNLSITGLSVTAALAVAALEWCQLMTEVLPRDNAIRQALAAVDFPAVGACLTALLLLAWAVAFIYQRRLKVSMAPPATLGR